MICPEIGVQIEVQRSGRTQLAHKKAPKGTVSVQNFRGRLRLCWSFQGERYYLYTGLLEGKVNRLVAESKARIIQADIATGNFDRTLAKYKPECDRIQKISVVDLFQRFTDHKAKSVYPQSLLKYTGLLGHLKQFFREKPANKVSDQEAEQFREWLLKKLQPITIRERIALLNACWKWAEKKRLVKENPWTEIVVKVPPKQRVKPFTKAEIERILQGFKSDSDYHYYLNFVEFLLFTGCRIGEAISLKWKHLNENCSVCWIGESYYRGMVKETKTGLARFVTLTSRLQRMLLARRPAGYKSDDLVFPSRRGGYIDDHNFRNRAWKTVLSRAGVEYRKPYATRHTLTSHALDMGMSPAEIAELTGHQVQTLFRYYAGNVRNRPRLPELLGDD